MFYLYRFLNDENEILYVGKTKQSLSDRFYAHCHLPEECYNKTKKIECALCKTESDLHIYENYYILCCLIVLKKNKIDSIIQVNDRIVGY